MKALNDLKGRGRIRESIMMSPKDCSLTRRENRFTLEEFRSYFDL